MARGFALIAWPVATLTVKVGDRVTKGQVLAAADATDLDAQIADANRAAKSAALRLTQAQVDRDDASTSQQKRQTQQSLYDAQTAAASKQLTDMATGVATSVDKAWLDGAVGDDLVHGLVELAGE